MSEDRKQETEVIGKIRTGHDAVRVEKLSKDIYFCWFKDLSACLVDSSGKYLKSAMDGYDFISDFKSLENIYGKGYFAIKGIYNSLSLPHKVISVIDGNFNTVVCRDLVGADEQGYSIDEFLKNEREYIRKQILNHEERQWQEMGHDSIKLRI